MERNHYEDHYVARVGWLRAAVLGANDGIVSTASLIVGVAAASDRSGVMLAGMAGLAAGALSMAAGEYVSVSSQADTEKADTERERAEIAADPQEELRALAGIYEDRGLSPDLALQVATALHAKDPLAAHLRDELGFSHHSEAKPLVAAGASALSFAVGAAMLFEGGLSFLGLGDPNVISWGRMIGQNRSYLLDAWWTVTFPGLALFLTVLSVALIGDGINDALDPRS